MKLLKIPTNLKPSQQLEFRKFKTKYKITKKSQHKSIRVTNEFLSKNQQI